MGTTVSHAIKIAVRSRFEEAHSDLRAGSYFYSYRITIRNTGPDAVQLQRRRWLIHDSLAPMREVEGPGVVGETPTLEPGQEFTYSSACDLRSAFGRMDGTYFMQRISDGLRFEVEVPPIELIYPFAAN